MTSTPKPTRHFHPIQATLRDMAAPFNRATVTVSLPAQLNNFVIVANRSVITIGIRQYRVLATYSVRPLPQQTIVAPIN